MCEDGPDVKLHELEAHKYMTYSYLYSSFCCYSSVFQVSSEALLNVIQSLTRDMNPVKVGLLVLNETSRTNRNCLQAVNQSSYWGSGAADSLVLPIGGRSSIRIRVLLVTPTLLRYR